MNTNRWLAAACGHGAMLVSAALPAQSIARRVSQVNDGTVRMSFAARSDVCGNGAGNISTGNGTNRTYRSNGNGNGTGTTSRHNEWEEDCDSGPVRAAIDIADGKPIALRTYVGGRWRAGTDITDIGTVSTKDAVDYLLDNLARASGVLGESGRRREGDGWTR